MLIFRQFGQRVVVYGVKMINPEFHQIMTMT